jgi:hypothetical protein
MQRPFYFDSLTNNPSFTGSAAGAHSGSLNVQAGDVLEWECRVDNDSDIALRYTNEIQAGEMCNLFGETVGVNVSCVVF